MKTVITIKKSDGIAVTVFTSHIAYIEHATSGCIIFINAGSNEHAVIETAYTREELLVILEKD